MSSIEKKAERLSPGSVWESVGGSRYTVLAITNLSIAVDENASARQKEIFPTSVVFLNEENEIFSCDAERFLRMYQWLYYDKLIDSCMSQVYAANLGELGPVDRKKIEIEQERASKQDKNEEVTLAEQMLGGKYTIQFIPVSEESKPLVGSDALSQSLASYSVTLDSTGAHFYKFLFAINPVVNSATLNQVFNPEVSGEVDTYQKFIIESDFGIRDEIDWNTYCGLSLEVVNHESFLCLTLANIPEEEEEEDEDEGEEVNSTMVDAPEVSSEEAVQEIEEVPTEEENEGGVSAVTEESVASMEADDNESSTAEGITPVVEDDQSSFNESADEVDVKSENEVLPTDANLEIVSTENVSVTNDLELDDQVTDLCEESLPEENIEKNEVAADPETPHTLSAQLANAIAKKVIVEGGKE